MPPVVQSATLVQDFLRHSAARLPDKAALIAGDRRLTYAELAAAADRLAAALPRLGLKRGGRVAIDLPDGPEQVISIFGVLQAGGAFVLVDHAVKRPKLTRILDDCQASVVIMPSGQLAWAEPLVADVPSLKTVILSPRHPGGPDQLPCLSFEAIQDQFGCQPLSVGSIDCDLARLVYSCTADGNSRGVMFEHSSLVFATHALTKCLDAGEDARFLVAAPLSDCGLYYLLVAFTLGATVVLAPDGPAGAALPELLARENITLLAASPPGLAELAQVDLGPHDLSRLAAVVSTAEQHDPGAVRLWQKALPGVPLILLQSFAEAQVALYLPSGELNRGARCAGLPIPGTEAWLEDGGGKVFASGRAGELLLRGRHLMRGYWGDPSPARCLQRRHPGETVCYTGDLYRRDAEGYFYPVAYGDGVICTWGHKVAPSEVEDVLYRLPGVSEVVVIGVPEPPAGQAFKAFVVCEDGDLTASDVINHCRAYLESYKVPRYVEICQELPTTAAGTVIKSALV